VVVLNGRFSIRGWALGILVVLACAGAAARELQPPASRVIHVTAERFAFTPSRIVVEAGEEVELRIKSDDTAHGFRIAGTNVSVVLPKRGKGEVRVRLQHHEPGRYRIECTRVCGAGHTVMRGELIVRPRPDGPAGR
jgi:cytochrome c oxidase subunit 2